MRVHRAGREQRGERSYRCRIAGAAEVPRVLVQRTLAGSGTLHLDGRRHAVPPGHALVVAIPGPATWCYE
ncbi:MAG: hypothetical protein J0M02_09125, partial [Planctomycetes bacterium]|nr:hypothetical protein [Planctomycetota bacterium]